MKKCTNPLEICSHMIIRNGVYYCDSKRCVLHNEKIDDSMNEDINKQVNNDL